VTDSHGTGRGETERHHEHDAGDIERDLVRRGRHRVEPCGQRRRQRENADFERNL
jgi:hypothetical protein